MMSEKTVGAVPQGLEDGLFREKSGQIHDFVFDQRVAEVFDDMVGRSVPFYSEIQRMVIELALDFLPPDGTLYDLGCSTGTTLSHLLAQLPEGGNPQLIGVDSSQDMLDRCRLRLSGSDAGKRVRLICADINELPAMENCSVVIMLLTLQFVRPLQRESLLRRIRDRLQPGGIVLLVEKVLTEPAPLNRRYISYYHDFKARQGYSALEIAQKREALENVLVPYSVEENRELLRRSGFSSSELFFRWYNFAGLIALV